MNSQDWADARDTIHAAHNERIWQALLDDIRASGLTPAAARRRWASQPGLVEAVDDMLPLHEEMAELNDLRECGPMDLCGHHLCASVGCIALKIVAGNAALAAAKEPTNEK